MAGNLHHPLVWCKMEKTVWLMAAEEDANLITAVDIVKKYGKERALDSVSLEVARGEVTCVIGANGSGKSTLLSVIAGLLAPDSGQVLYEGAPLVKSREALRSIGFVPQQDSLFADLTVKENLAFWAAAAKAPLGAAMEQPAVKELGLEAMLRKRVGHLSGGMRRRVAIAAALVSEPTLLILDEPFAGLDLFHKNQLTGQIQQLRRSGVTVVYTSHNADEIVPLSDTVYLLHRGRMALHTTADALPGEQVALNEYLLKLIRGETGK